MLGVTYIVECSICSQPWEVPFPLVSAPPAKRIAVPDHGMLNAQTSKATSTPCPGIKQAGTGRGRRDDWEKGWSQRKPGQPLPEVLDGSPVQFLDI
jgi:hypothetical protein